MKNRVGTLYGKPVVIGDKNLVNANEIHVSNLSNNEVLDTTGFIKLSSLMELGDSSIGTPDVYASAGFKINFEDENVYSIIENNKIDKKLNVEIEVLHNTTIFNVYTEDYHNAEHIFDKIIKIKFKRLIPTENNGNMHICSGNTLCSYFQASGNATISWVGLKPSTILNQEVAITSDDKCILVNEDKTKAYWIIYE